MNKKSKQQLSDKLKQMALEQGFDAVGISNIETLKEERSKLQEWLSQGFHGDMGYMERNIEKRTDPSVLVDGAQSVISVLLNYYPEKQLPEQSYYKISKYAYGTDYHFVIKEKLQHLMDFIEQEFPGTPMRMFTDSAPVLDKSWAIRSGLGWMGKHSLLINKEIGSFFFIGEIIVGLDLQSDEAYEKSYCGTCTKCIDACPTDAITEPYVLDAKKCISYLTIEARQDVPEQFKNQLNNWIYGCDICQDVCPWNAKVKPGSEPAFRLSDDLLLMKKEDWEQMDKLQFNKLFKNSPVKRGGFKRLKATISLLKGEI
ncbi:MAG: tRNA epoxyqueuosine(34) reductase QueG [Bacteroidetes bacterium]|nr:MAG: tRNA epoxyqueuosine(34) reductase QueG [Bacteroidota bacterium]